MPRFDDYPPYILLHPFARGDGKSLSNKVIEEFCRAFAPTRVVVVGRSQRKIDPPENCVELTNQTSLLQLIRLIRAASFIISVGQRPDAHRRRRDRSLIVDPHLDRSAPRRPLQSRRLDLEKGQIVRVSELETAKLRRGGRKFKPKDVAAVKELVRPLVPVDPMLV